MESRVCGALGWAKREAGLTSVPRAGSCHPLSVGVQSRKAQSEGKEPEVCCARTGLPESGTDTREDRGAQAGTVAGLSETRSSPVGSVAHCALLPQEGPLPSPLIIWHEGSAKAPTLLPGSCSPPGQRPLSSHWLLQTSSCHSRRPEEVTPTKFLSPCPACLWSLPLPLSLGYSSLSLNVVLTCFPRVTSSPGNAPVPTGLPCLWPPLLIWFLFVFHQVTMLFDPPTTSPLLRLYPFDSHNSSLNSFCLIVTHSPLTCYYRSLCAHRDLRANDRGHPLESGTQAWGRRTVIEISTVSALVSPWAKMTVILGRKMLIVAMTVKMNVLLTSTLKNNVLIKRRFLKESCRSLTLKCKV